MYRKSPKIGFRVNSLCQNPLYYTERVLWGYDFLKLLVTSRKYFHFWIFSLILIQNVSKCNIFYSNFFTSTKLFDRYKR